MDTRSFQIPSEILIRKIIVLFLGLFLAYYLGAKIGQSDTGGVKAIVVVGVGLWLCFSLGKKSWYLLPVAMGFGISVPLKFGRDFSLDELIIMVLLIHTLLMVALRQVKIEIFTRKHGWLLLYCLWALLVFACNPTGLYSLGSETVGLRFYFHMVLGAIAVIIISNANIEEKDARNLLIIFFIQSIVGVFQAYFFRAKGDVWDAIIGIEQYYTWQQALAGPSLTLALFFFAKYSVRDLFSAGFFKWWIILPVAFVCMLFSGKRAEVGVFLMLPFFNAFLRKQMGFGLIIMSITLVGGLFLSLGHGNFYRLPTLAQRALSFFPGKWDREADLGFVDDYRMLLRRDAIAQIQERPLIGKGYAFNVNDYFAERATMTQQISGITAGGNWHTTWLGIGADFGLPAVLFWAFWCIYVTRMSLRTARGLPRGTMRKILASFLFLMCCRMLMRSWTSGHSAEIVMDFWFYAMIFPLFKDWKEEDRRLAMEKKELQTEGIQGGLSMNTQRL